MGDDTERCRAESRAGIGELRVIERVVELGAESQLRVLPEPPDGCNFADGNIRVELSRAPDDPYARISVTCGAIGADYRSRADGRLIEVTAQARDSGAGGQEVAKCRAWANCREP